MKSHVKLIIVSVALFLIMILTACSSSNIYIGKNRNWWIGGEDSGIHAQGPQGDKGETGEQGPQGIQGPQGDKGETGAQGPQGIQGAQGDKGDRGEQGPQGEKGETGAQGPQGDNGETPYIGQNGNWWIGDHDTGVLADYSSDTRKISDGLSFEIRTVNSVGGMVVIGYDGTDVNVVIPNYIGSVPVIGISQDAFFETDYIIESVSLSKNTIWLDEYVFCECQNLSHVDFNGAKLTEIPKYAFCDTKLTSVELPETVTKLGDYAFAETYISKINYENITYFGEESLATTALEYVYLNKNVEFVGEDAFYETFVFIENEIYPSEWATTISASSNIYKPITGAKILNDYIYTIKNNSAAIHRYVGSEKKIQIPTFIDEYTVTEIGRGFDSYNNNFTESFEYFDFALEEVIIPSTVKTIDFGSFLFSRSFIYVPKSVETFSYSALDEEYFELAFFAFEGEESPFENNSNYDFVRFATDIKYKNLVYDEQNEIYLYEDTFGYSVIASLVKNGGKITIPGQYNGKSVHTIKTWAIRCSGVEIYISDGINKIQQLAIYDENSILYIPKSVSIINANGVTAKYCFVEAKEKRDEWDTYWNYDASIVIFGVPSDYQIDLKNQMLYQVTSNEVTLLRYFGSSSTVYIPREINGYTVTKIASNFYESRSASIYIPKEIEMIESKAFNSTSSYTFYFYFEIDKEPSNWAQNWYYNSYSDNSSSYISKYWSRDFSY